MVKSDIIYFADIGSINNKTDKIIVATTLSFSLINQIKIMSITFEETNL